MTWGMRRGHCVLRQLGPDSHCGWRRGHPWRLSSLRVDFAMKDGWLRASTVYQWTYYLQRHSLLDDGFSILACRLDLEGQNEALLRNFVG